MHCSERRIDLKVDPVSAFEGGAETALHQIQWMRVAEG
jgi:hypothetical protein